MNATAEEMSDELREELAANDAIRIKDTRSQPVRWSHLMAMAKSPAHCLHAFQFDDRKETLSMRIGSGTHGLATGQKVVVYPGKVRRGKEYDAFKALHPYATILSSKEMFHAQSMNKALRAHPEAARLLFGPTAVRERTILWDTDGRTRRSTPDVLIPGEAVVEIKTARCAEPDRFRFEAMRAGYHGQCASYRMAVEATTGKRLPVYIVAVENSAPYAVTVMRLTDRMLDMGERLERAQWERLMVCERDGVWPSYCAAVVELDAPEDDLDLDFGDDDVPDVDDEASA